MKWNGAMTAQQKKGREAAGGAGGGGGGGAALAHSVLFMMLPVLFAISCFTFSLFCYFGSFPESLSSRGPPGGRATGCTLLSSFPFFMSLFLFSKTTLAWRVAMVLSRPERDGNARFCGNLT